ncbi:MAG: glycosyltransferase [Candidatus Methanomethylicia archaeon]
MLCRGLVSVVIPTYNSERTVERTLKSILNQSYGDIEVIVIDNCSSDNTRGKALKYTENIICVKCSRSRARNIGVNIANGDYIVFIDSDEELTGNVIAECVNEFIKGADAVIIPEISFSSSILLKALNIGRKLYEAQIPRAYRKSILDMLGGFDEELTFGEDWDLYIRALKRGLKTSSINSYIIHHEAESFKQYVRKYYDYGRSFKILHRKHRGYAIKRYGLTPKLLVSIVKVRDPAIPLYITIRLILTISTILGVATG